MGVILSPFRGFAGGAPAPRQLTPPSQRDWSRHRVLERLAGALGFQVRGFQLEIPFSGAVGIVDQHQMWVVFQTFGLHLHGAAVLLDELSEDKLQHLWDERNPAEKIPGSDYIDAAMGTSDRGHCRQAGEPVLPCADCFGANVGEHKIDGRRYGIRVGVEAQQLVGRRV